MASIEERVETLVKPTIESIGYDLYDVEYAKEGKNYFLRIFIDKDGGIDLEDCEKVNDGIMDLLDEADYIKEQYFLEISSPGIERNLRKDEHFISNISKEIEVHLYRQVEGKKEIKGILKEYNEKYLIIDEIKVEKENIALAKTIYNWEEK